MASQTVRTMYLSPHVYRWNALQSEQVGELQVGGTASLGFAQVYASYVDFKEDWPDYEPMAFEFFVNENVA